MSNRSIIRSLYLLSVGTLLSLGGASQAYAVDWTPVLDGVELTTYSNVHAVRIDVGLVGVSIQPRVSEKGEPLTPKSWAVKHGLQVAVNANFFAMSTHQDPCSFAICNGVNWGGIYNPDTYAQMGFTKDGRLKWLEQASTESAPAWMYNVVAGTPEIVKNGAVLSVANSPACQSLGHCSSQAHRTGMAVDKSGKYLILAVTKYGAGLTVEKFAQKLVDLGADYAINLDGGGSSGMYVNGKVYGANGAGTATRTVAVNLGFYVNPKPSYVCKAAEVDEPSNIFYDMPSNHWGLSAAKALYEHDITKGCGGEPGRPLFCPSCGVKRVQAAIFIARALHLTPLKPSTPSFSDVSASNVGEEAWGAVEACLNAGIISQAATFRPDDVLTRAEGATMLSRAYPEKVGGNVDLYANAPTPTFSDVPPSFWGYRYIEAMARNCFVSGKGGGLFDPSGLMTRIEFAAILARISGLIDNPSCAFVKQCSVNGEKSCSNGKLQSCVAYETVTENCASGLECRNGECVSVQECSAGPATCSGNAVRECRNGFIVETPCASFCENGQCVECLSSTQPSCESNAVINCVNGRIDIEPCGQGEKCSESQCVSAKTCEQYSAKCDGDQVYTCLSGRWVQTNDCSIDGKACEGGLCVVPRVCDAGIQSCNENGVRIACSSAGQWETRPCGAGEVCQEGECYQSGNEPPVDIEDDPVENTEEPGNSEHPIEGNDDEPPVTPPEGENTESPSSESQPSENPPAFENTPTVIHDDSCSMGNGGGNPLHWMMALLIGFCMALSRRRKA